MRKSLLICFVLLVALVGFSQGIRIVEPQDGATVKGEVPIRIEGAERGYAYLTLDGEFLTAFNLPSVFKWDTQTPYGFRTTTPKDGEHTLAVRVYDGAELLGEAQVKITLKNKIEFPAGEAVKLAYRYKEGEEHKWKTEASREGVELELQWKEYCNEVLQPKETQPVILLTDRVENGRLVYQRRTVAPHPDIGKYFFVNIFQNGEKADIRSLLRATPLAISTQTTTQNLFGWGQLRISFPVDKGVKLNEDWEAPLIFVADIESGEPHIALGRHKIEDVVWVKGYKCLKIRSTFEGRVEIPAGGQMGTGAGMMPGMMMPGAMGPSGMMPGMMGPGAMGPGAMPGGTASGMMGSGMPQIQSALNIPQGAGAPSGMVGAMAGRTVGRIPVNVEGTRITYFAFEEGKIVKIEDEIRVRPQAGREREGETTTGRAMPGGMMPGMMGPGAMGPGAMPGGMMPGMMGPGAMGPGAMPGGMMPGMMGPGAMGPGAMPGGTMPGMMGPGAMGPGAMPGGMMPGMMGPGAMGPGAMPGGMMGPGAMGFGAMPGGMMGPGAMGPGAIGMPAFAGGTSATPAGRAMGPFMAGPAVSTISTAYTLKVTSEMTD